MDPSAPLVFSGPSGPVFPLLFIVGQVALPVGASCLYLPLKFMTTLFGLCYNASHWFSSEGI